jgi:excisionase family DNA binding protein
MPGEYTETSRPFWAVSHETRATYERLVHMAKNAQPPVEAAISTILTTQQAAERIQCTPRYIQRMVRSGRLRALKPTGKLVRFRQSDLDAFLESGASVA